MPFTPFHIGAGLLAKGASPTNVSLTAFIASQVFIDIPVGINMIFDMPYIPGESGLHGNEHTFIGGTVWLLIFMGLWIVWEKISKHGISRKMAWYGAAIGFYSHVLLDSIVHFDIWPFWPISRSNPFLGLLTWGGVELLCLGMAAVGGALIHYRKSSATARLRAANKPD